MHLVSGTLIKRAKNQKKNRNQKKKKRGERQLEVVLYPVASETGYAMTCKKNSGEPNSITGYLLVGILKVVRFLIELKATLIAYNREYNNPGC